MPIAGSLEATFEASPVGGWLIDKENFQRRLHPQMAHDYAMNIYPIDSYAFGVLDVQLSEVEKSSKAKLEALEKEYLLNGLVTSVQLVLVLHNRGHPHVLALQRDADLFTLPGGFLERGEGDEACIKRVLSQRLFVQDGWQVKDLLSTWWRPNFEIYTYPYCPPHVTRPKEQIKIYLIQLSENLEFSVPKALNLVAVPLMELYDSSARFGPVIASLPHLLSRYDLIPMNPSSPPLLPTDTEQEQTRTE